MLPLLPLVLLVLLVLPLLLLVLPLVLPLLTAASDDWVLQLLRNQTNHLMSDDQAPSTQHHSTSPQHRNTTAPQPTAHTTSLLMSDGQASDPIYALAVRGHQVATGGKGCVQVFEVNPLMLLVIHYYWY